MNDKLCRSLDWVEKLEKFLRKASGKQFQWGQHDCCTVACDAVKEMTGVDLAHFYQRYYDTARGARRLLKREGGLESICLFVAKEHDLVEVPVLFARRGDVVLFNNPPDDVALGVVSLNGREILSAAERGLSQVPIRMGIRAWRI